MLTGDNWTDHHDRYRARVESPASPEQVEALLRETDAVAEVHNTVRAGVPVVRARWEAAPDGGKMADD